MNTHIYTSPFGFWWDLLSNDAPFEADPKLQTYNAPEEAKGLIDYLEDQERIYDSEHLFVYFGMDFRYQDAFINYRSIDGMIKYFNTYHSEKYHFVYSTPSNYIDAINAMNKTWTTKYDDMFPYADADNSFWTGYFSSRASAKS